MENNKVLQLNTSTLAYIGDAVYELEIRRRLLEHKPSDAGKLHHTAIRYVSSDGQAKVAKTLCEERFLDEAEERLLKRARNHRATSRPQNADPRKYKWATGFEALIGYLYLTDNHARIEEVVTYAMEIIRRQEH